VQGAEEPATADVEGLRRFLETQVLPWFEARKKELANRLLIREQAFGEALDIQIDWTGLPGMRSTSTGNWSACLQYCYGSKTCGGAPFRANPFRKMAGRSIRGC